MPEPGRLLPSLPLRRRAERASLRQHVNLPTPPPSADWTGGQTQWGMLANDTVGDCVEAAMFHAIELTSHVTGNEASFGNTDALALYEVLAQYNPADPSTDVGTDPTAAVDYWEQTGIGGAKALAAGECANVTADYQACIAFLGFAFYAFNVPQSAMDQYRAGEYWDVVPNDGGIVGGHEVLLVGYDGQMVTLITWGQLWWASWTFVLRYAALTYGVVLPEWIGQAGVSPSGLTPGQLVSDAGALGAAPTPTPSPSTGLPDPGTGVRLWADVSAPPPDVATLCLIVNALRLDGFIIRCNDQAIWTAWTDAIESASEQLHTGIGIGAYLDMSVTDPSNWPALIQTVSGWVNGEEEFRLDLETGSPSEAQISAALRAAQQLQPGVAGIYTSASYWQSIGNPQVGGLCSLWLAAWNTPVSFNVWFGGWTRAAKVQYAPDIMASGLQLDLSAVEG